MSTAKKIKTSEILALSSKKILAVNPPVFDFAFMDLWSKPLGLLFLIESLRENNSVAFIDCIAEGAESEKTFGRLKIKKRETAKPDVYKNIPRRFNHFGLGREEIEKRLENIYESSAPDIILVTSFMTYWYLGVKWIINLLKKKYPETPVILGGIYASLCTSHAEAIGADYIVCDRCEPIAPYPAFDIYKSPRYGVLMTSFGCPFSCRYCASNVLWHKYTRRSFAGVMRDFEFQLSLGITDMAFYDDALLLGKEEFFYPMAEAISGMSKTLRLHTPNGLHVRQIDERCAGVLYGNNFRTIRLSLESIDPKIAHDSSFKVARDEYRTAVRNLRAAGYTKEECETYILVGLPGQDIQSVRDTITFVKENGGKPKLAEFSPIPGTPHFEEAAKKLPALRAEPLLQNNSVYCAYFSNDIEPSVLQELKDTSR